MVDAVDRPAEKSPQQQADEIAEQVLAQVERVRTQQRTALSITGTASSQDGSVRAVVDATGVVTSLEFAPSALDRSSLDRLARTVVATIQSAAAQARERMTESWQAWQGPDSEILAKAAAATGRLGLPRIGVPEVPRTETDQTGLLEAWQVSETTPDTDKPKPTDADFDNDRLW